jgi:hypothetical protein
VRENERAEVVEERQTVRLKERRKEEVRLNTLGSQAETIPPREPIASTVSNTERF